MIITCPHCDTRYQINPASFQGRGRRVKCASCGHRWLAEVPGSVDPDGPPPFPEVVPGEPEEARSSPATGEPPPGGDRDDEEEDGDDGPARPEPEALAPSAGPGARVRRSGPTPLDAAPDVRGGGKPATRAGGRGGLAGWLLVALVVLLLAAAYLARDEIVGLYPPAQGLYERLGLPVSVALGLEIANFETGRREENGAVTAVVAGDIRNVTAHDVRVPKLRLALLDERHEELQAGSYDPPQPTLAPSASARFELTVPNPPPATREVVVTFEDRPS